MHTYGSGQHSQPLVNDHFLWKLEDQLASHLVSLPLAKSTPFPEKEQKQVELLGPFDRGQGFILPVECGQQFARPYLMTPLSERSARVEGRRPEQYLTTGVNASQNVSAFSGESCYYSSVMICAHAQPLVVFGDFFLDLVFYNLPTVPAMGEEVKTAQFATFPGGGVATTAMVAASLGTPTGVITRLGKDAQAYPAWQKLVRSGVSTEGCVFDKNLATAVTICASYNGERMMITHDTINENLMNVLLKPLARKQLKKTRFLHLACALWPLSSWTKVIKQMKECGLTLSADLGWNPKMWESPRLFPLLRHFEFVFPNEREACAMTGEKSVERAAFRLAQWTRTPVVKLGKNGSMALRDGKLLRMKSIRVRAVDATGAGDAFNGGFLHAYLSGWSLEECLRAGNVCGALATTGAGGSCAIPSRQKLKELMRKL